MKNSAPESNHTRASFPAIEILSELQRLSGRSIGAEPARWSEWWQGVGEGRIALPADIAAAGGQSSSATFFGLRAATDRVVFVVDRSGSMRTPFDTGGRSRHAEAIDQLVRFLRQSGEDTRFSMALFSDQGVTWRSRLAPASEANLELARRWLDARRGELQADSAFSLQRGARPKEGLERHAPETCLRSIADPLEQSLRHRGGGTADILAQACGARHAAQRQDEVSVSDRRFVAGPEADERAE